MRRWLGSLERSQVGRVVEGDDVGVLHLQDLSSADSCQPIRDQYFIVSTNQRSVFYCVNQSEVSILVSTDQRLVL